mmetsp:Transcript_2610/g.1737  ORF Transcript_2610/g.1737 Transcript_2610/m.1737 type:complete len:312 (-) Transcript_2610:362-1297(-)
MKQRVDTRVAVAVSGALALFGIFASSYTTQPSTFILFYTVFNGIGSGVCYIIPLIVNWEHFPANKGLVTGITLSAYGFSAFIFSLLSTELMNPNDIPCERIGEACIFPAEVSDKVPSIMRFLAYSWICLVAISVVLISRPPLNMPSEDSSVLITINQEDNTVSEEGSMDGDNEDGNNNMVIRNFTDCIYSVRFWQLSWLMFSSMVFINFFSYSYKNFALLNDIPDSSITMAASIGSGLVNGAIRLVVGGLYNKLGSRVILASAMIPMTIVSLTCFVAVKIPLLFFVCVIVNFATIGVLFSTIPTAVQNVFG